MLLCFLDLCSASNCKLSMGLDLQTAWFRCRMIVGAWLQVREWERGLRVRWNETCMGQATPFPFPDTINVAFLKLCGPKQFAGCFCLPPLISDDSWFGTPIGYDVELLFAEKEKTFCAQYRLLSFVLSCKHVIRVKWGAFCIWEEMNVYIEEVGSILLLNNHIWWWHQVYTWYSHGAFPHKCRIHLSEDTQPLWNQVGKRQDQ